MVDSRWIFICALVRCLRGGPYAGVHTHVHMHICMPMPMLHWSSQAAAHTLLLAQGSGHNRSGGSNVALDAQSRLFLTLYACRGAAAAPRAFGARQRGGGV